MIFNAAKAHLMMHMLPPMASALALAVILLALLWRSEDLKRFSLLLIISVPLLIIPVYYSGKRAVVVVGNIPGVPLEIIGEHEESVKSTWWAATAAGVVALAGYVRFRGGSTPLWFLAVAAVASIIVDVYLVRTAHLGGQIRHPEGTSIVLSSTPN